MRPRHSDEAVERRHHDQPLDGTLARQKYGHAAAEAAAHHRHARLAGTHIVVHCQGVGGQRGLGRSARAAAIAAVIDEVQRVIRERGSKSRQVPRDLLGIAAEMDQRPRSRSRHDPDLERGAGAIDLARWKIDLRALHPIHEHAHQQIRGHRGEPL
jgi:hypothetical protein